MASTTRKWLVGCGLGCAGAIALAIGGPIVLGLLLMPPLDRAVEVQKKLTAELGARDDYAPPAGAPTPERIEAFLAVRRAVMAHCGRFTEFDRDLGRMDELGRQSDRPKGGEMFRAISGMTRSVLGLVGDIGELNETRNRALMDQRMGLGEYTWLYTLVYHSWLEHPVPDDSDSDDGDGDGHRVERLRAVLLGMMRRHAEALTQAGLPEPGKLWRDEADRMERAAAEVPFGAGGLPAPYADAFAARGDELRAAWCEPMARFEMGEVRRSGLSVHSE